VVAVPEGAKVKVEVGEAVPADGDLLEIGGTNEKVVNVSGRIGGLSAAEKKKLAEMLPGMKLTENEVVFETKGIFPKKIMLQINGEVIKIDEFGNIHYKEAGEVARKVSCPVAAKVIKKDSRTLEMEFRAIEYVGRGINEGKAWGLEGMAYEGDIAGLSIKDKGKIILTEKFDQAWLFKAEVVGAAGVVAADDGREEKDDRISLKLPILALEKSEWEELRKNVGEVKRAMINATIGRLLLVI
jgi:hypothetical protein